MIKGNKFACLTYHTLAERADQYALSERQFKDQLALLQREACVIDGFEGLELKLRLKQSIPCRYVVLTADDGYVSAMRVADILGKYGCGGNLIMSELFEENG